MCKLRTSSISLFVLRKLFRSCKFVCLHCLWIILTNETIDVFKASRALTGITTNSLWLCYLKVERNLKGEEEKRLRLVDPMKRWSAFIFLTLLPSSLQVTFRFFFPRTESFYPVFFKHYVISLAKSELRPLSFIFFWVMFWQSVEREKII